MRDIPRAVLPSDPHELRAVAASLQAELAARDAEVYAKTLHIERLKAHMAVLRWTRRFGRSSEKLDTRPDHRTALSG